MYSADKLNKQSDNVQPWCSPFPILNQSVVPCKVLNAASWSTYRFLRRQAGIIFWYSHHFKNYPHFVVTHSNRERSRSRYFSGSILIFLWSNDVGNLISGSFSSSKPIRYIWIFSVPVLLKPWLKDFVYYITRMWNEHNCMVVWTFFGIVFLWDWNGTWHFWILWPMLSFPNLLTYWK